MSDPADSSEPHTPPHAHSHPRRLLPLTLTALGVVYGDIGTSPLYAIRECFFGSHAVPPTYENVLGVLSLIIYALVLLVFAGLRAGRVWGLENWCQNLPICRKFPRLRALLG